MLVLAACGPLENRGPQLQFNFVLSALLADSIAKLQISIVTKGRSLGDGDCVKVQTTCLVNQLPADRFVPVRDAKGNEVRAVVVDLDVKPVGVNSSQQVVVQGIPLGKDYGLVIEALSKDSPPMLAGSSCNYLQEINPGANPEKLAVTIRPLSPPVNCDPRVDKTK